MILDLIKHGTTVSASLSAAMSTSTGLLPTHSLAQIAAQTVTLVLTSMVNVRPAPQAHTSKTQGT